MNNWAKLGILVGVFALLTASRLFGDDEDSMLQEIAKVMLPGKSK